MEREGGDFWRRESSPRAREGRELVNNGGERRWRGKKIDSFTVAPRVAPRLHQSDR
jgi:hypothetical protein